MSLTASQDCLCGSRISCLKKIKGSYEGKPVRLVSLAYRQGFCCWFQLTPNSQWTNKWRGRLLSASLILASTGKKTKSKLTEWASTPFLNSIITKLVLTECVWFLGKYLRSECNQSRKVEKGQCTSITVKNSKEEMAVIIWMFEKRLNNWN